MLIERQVVQFVVAEWHVGDREIERPIAERGGLETLSANVRVRIELTRDPGGQWIDLDAG